MKHYIKTYLLSLILIFSTAFAFAADPYAHLVLYDSIKKDFFEKIASGEKATYSICISPNYEKLNGEDANKYFLGAFNAWFDKLSRYITNKKGFEDIFPIIENAKNIERLPCKDKQEADLVIKFNTKVPRSCNDADACFMFKTEEIIVSKSLPLKEMKIVLTHELGHAFGLGDQYDGETFLSSFIYNTKIKRPSIMGIKNHLTCDDIDGLITSIDRVNNKKREFDSFCRDGIHISKGIPQDKTGNIYKLQENYDTFDADIKITYVDNLPEKQTYLIDLTMSNFLIDYKGVSLLKVMGFKVDDFNIVKNAKVKIHGRVKETIAQRNEEEIYRVPLGLWSLILYVNEKAKQIVTVEYDDDTPEIILQMVDENTFQTIEEILLPLINHYPFQGVFEKEAIRQEFINAQKKKGKKVNTKVEEDKLIPFEELRGWGIDDL